MTTYRISSSSLPPSFTSRERAVVDGFFGKGGRGAQAKRERSSLIVAASAVLVAIGLMFTVHGPAHADRIPASAVSASFDVASR